MKLWEKGIPVNKAIEDFTVGKDRELDLYLAPSDILGSMAHIIMLESVGLIDKNELPILIKKLKELYKNAVEGDFVIEDGVEDVHSQVEFLLTEELGDLGKKIHSGRSRNDQVLLDLKLFTRDAIKEIVESTSEFINVLIERSDETKSVLMPGYTHLQVAMPSSFGLWFGAYAESLTDDLELLLSAYKITNQNPLGSAAGYGSSFPLNRQMTTDLLGFNNMNYNVVYAQMGRGKVEKIVSFAVANLASTLSKLAYDVCLFMSQNFNFVSLPTEFTTGSSIMPHKKNPDVFELIRARCNKLQGIPNQISLVTNNLPSGYFRDLQMVKEVFLPSFKEMNDCLNIATLAIKNMTVNSEILEDSKYDFVFSVEEVNKLVLKGIPFREAYKQIGEQIEKGEFQPEKEVDHSHEGSIGNLCLDKILDKKETTLENFEFKKIELAIKQLLG
ncbi:MAG: argininosuccinate lyase [Prolixibacteraceae bacterium]|jgi:argininosuccinate lyase|nr:argininosuccinate lyase [Prolixibacteraceae bacterium]MBT6766211.1 argininosuccinate lyase [Prolixibacteraceae bacterium]MBT6998634.1 argininosuccinate lyase [Prolixibacteraceae bacterium]MBT7397435.1 argininosuccinate lyase [Prolixibacteraceae bacterium]